MVRFCLWNQRSFNCAQLQIPSKRSMCMRLTIPPSHQEDGNSYLFCQEIINSSGRDVLLTTWSAKGQRMRDLFVRVPESSPPCLGLTLQWCPLSITEEIWHILDVAPNSPADLAGLLPYSDYIIGTPEGLVRGESGLGELVQNHIDQSLRLYVYNNEYDILRELTITPNRSWGGEGMLGCVLGFGALHRLPAPLHEPVQAPGETLFESNPETEFPPTEPTNLITPAIVYKSTASPNLNKFNGLDLPGIAPSTKKARRRHEHPAQDVEDYFREGEAMSKALEPGGAATGSRGLPPPPKSVKVVARIEKQTKMQLSAASDMESD